MKIFLIKLEVSIQVSTLAESWPFNFLCLLNVKRSYSLFLLLKINVLLIHPSSDFLSFITVYLFFLSLNVLTHNHIYILKYCKPTYIRVRNFLQNSWKPVVFNTSCRELIIKCLSYLRLSEVKIISENPTVFLKIFWQILLNRYCINLSAISVTIIDAFLWHHMSFLIMWRSYSNKAKNLYKLIALAQVINDIKWKNAV